MAEQSEWRIFATDPLPPGTRIACRIEYDGSAYNGWQAQPHPGSRTVQQTLEAALTGIAAEPLRVHCAGRTDSGVHGHAQVIHFDAPTARSCKAWVIGSNSRLPADIRVHWAQPVPADFHARFSAQARRYRYLIANTAIRPALLGRQLSWQRQPLDAGRMHAAAQFLLGERDFSAFRAAACQSSTPYRCVTRCEVSRRGDLVVIDIQANAFLHHMVRNIAGSLMAVGTGSREPAWIGELLGGQDRTRAAETAPAEGLYLVDVVYPARFALPLTPPGPLLLGS
ncbi:tRNA pseudouridine(38-40) synthase TruA [Haliea sp. E1-2-M8]|uniref:tRNA pseudouridine(38-40) synthase TruA n=1 Tax=Haliea sp. E1-2-M8 TaxID=3064706 RepID=UPI0027245CBA|nr:tRNA pseudouridine(38-40) synthase TruA [Haliea sp. E1-2-M8]MDO8862885.1 tRNA pseudouridine(38-40) synthase TruA [Haliea sp. E1-2-M8]